MVSLTIGVPLFLGSVGDRVCSLIRFCPGNLPPPRNTSTVLRLVEIFHSSDQRLSKGVADMDWQTY